MHKDTIVGIAGAAILVAAMAGVFWYEGTRGVASAGAQTFSIAFSGVEDNGPSTTGTSSVGTPDTAKLTIPTGNLTKIDFTLVWNDEANTAPDRFKITVQGPAGTGDPKTAEAANAGTGAGEVVVSFAIGELPTSTTVTADTEEQAEMRAMERNARMLGAGEWTITIELTEAGDATPVPLPGGLPVNPVDDASNAWELRTILTTFAAKATTA